MFTKSYAITLILITLLAPFLNFATLSSAETDKPFFTEVTAALGFKQTETPWQAGTYALPEIIGSGVALFDYDNDGALDVLHIRFPPPRGPHPLLGRGGPHPLLERRRREGSRTEPTLSTTDGWNVC